MRSENNLNIYQCSSDNALADFDSSYKRRAIEFGKIIMKRIIH